ncbi:WlaTC/HtrL family glycosyltransferase [Acinetobacter sp. RW6]|uniref:WlaTC/HtrL family glycosyltransferase n=1 Tax=Acinetobacter sp. RW6 TaxID=3242680 RepID=UPI0035C22E04
MSITIITACFDIGRGSWSMENGHPNYLECSTDKYFKYFPNLAFLANELVVFTSTNFVSKIKEIRGSKPTTMIKICVDEKFHECIETILKIQNNVQFQQKKGIEQLKNPEYWSAEYVLVNNLKYLNVMMKKTIIIFQTVLKS